MLVTINSNGVSSEEDQMSTDNKKVLEALNKSLFQTRKELSLSGITKAINYNANTVSPIKQNSGHEL